MPRIFGSNAETIGRTPLVDDGRILVGAMHYEVYGGAGVTAVHAFHRVNDEWRWEGRIEPYATSISTGLGYSIDIDGKTAVIGAFRDSLGGALHGGAAFVFSYGDAGWELEKSLRVSGPSQYDWLGLAVALDGGAVVAGAPSEDDTNGGWNVGGGSRGST